MSLSKIKLLSSVGAHAMQAPSGRWFLVGRFPVRAGYERKDGAPLTADDIEAICHAGPGFASDCRTKTYDTKEAALAAVESECAQ